MSKRLVVASGQVVAKNNWSKLGDVYAIQIGHGETANPKIVFHQVLHFVPAKGDMVLIVKDDCSSGYCKPTMVRLAKAVLE